MRRTIIVLTLALAACYAPHPPSGSYLCASNDAGTGGACPDSLTCVIGQCVSNASDAVARFSITADKATPATTKKVPSLTVSEHESFPITITALNDQGGVDGGGDNVVSNFNGAVTLSSTWGDVRVCASASSCPSTSGTTLQLTNGIGHGYIALNRETSPPQSAILRASFAAAVGTSGELALTVTSPVFSRDGNGTMPIAAPVETANGKWGFADGSVGAPYVVQNGGLYNMFVLAEVGAGAGFQAAIGLATSTDGKTFVAPTAPLIPPVADSSGSPIGAPAAIYDSTGVHLYYPTKQFFPSGQSASFAYLTISSQTASSTSATFGAASPVVDLTASPSDCPYCNAIDTPALIFDPTPALNGGSTSAKILYFSALAAAGTGSAATYSMSVVRAYAADGENFAVDPSPLIKSNSDETIIYAPRVLVDGTVYKMWYTYTSAADVGTATGVPTPCARAIYRVGYATSSDGYFWVRSPRNSYAAAPPAGSTNSPAMPISSSGWDAGKSVLVGSVLPSDGVDPANGIALYYSVFDNAARLALACVPNGIGRASRP